MISSEAKINAPIVIAITAIYLFSLKAGIIPYTEPPSLVVIIAFLKWLAPYYGIAVVLGWLNYLINKKKQDDYAPSTYKTYTPKKKSNNCPRCGKELIARHSKKNNTYFIGCTGYPKCTYTKAF